jgi:predicted nucleic acid-binding protein
MELLFLDTNVIIRYLTQDNPEQAEKAYRILQQVEAGTTLVTTSEAVIIEAVYVLSSRALYSLPRQEIREHLYTILALRGLKLPRKGVYLRALDLYASANLDFVDCLSVAHMERAKINTILSFDRDFDRIPSINRREP